MSFIRSLSVWAVISFFCLSFSLAEELPQKEVEVDFYSTEAIGVKPNGLITIAIAGRASQQGTLNYQGENCARHIIGEDIRILKLEKVTDNQIINTAEDGRFYFHAHLPIGQVQVALGFTPKGSSETIDILLSLEIKKGDVVLANEKKDFQEKTNYLWAGIGANYLSFDQKFNFSTEQNLSFESVATPEFSLGFSRFFTDYYKLFIELRSSPGATSSNNSVTVSQGNYSWEALVIDNAFFTNKNYPFKLYFGWKGRMQYRVGAQIHRIPFLIRTNSTTVDVKTENFGFLTVGGGFEGISPLRRWKTNIYLRFHSLVMNGDAINFKSSFSFEGLVGLNRVIDDNWMIGLQWNGQYLSGSYSGLTDPVTSSEVSGELSMLHTLIELRAFYGW